MAIAWTFRDKTLTAFSAVRETVHGNKYSNNYTNVTTQIHYVQSLTCALYIVTYLCTIYTVTYLCTFALKISHEFIFYGATALSRPWPPHRWGSAITLRHTTRGTSSLDEWSASRRDLYLVTHNTHDTHATGGIRTRNPSKASGSRPTPLTARPPGPAKIPFNFNIFSGD